MNKLKQDTYLKTLFQIALGGQAIQNQGKIPDTRFIWSRVTQEYILIAENSSVSAPL